MDLILRWRNSEIKRIVKLLLDESVTEQSGINLFGIKMCGKTIMLNNIYRELASQKIENNILVYKTNMTLYRSYADFLKDICDFIRYEVEGSDIPRLKECTTVLDNLKDKIQNEKDAYHNNYSSSYQRILKHMLELLDNKRLILIVDNFDDVNESFGDEREWPSYIRGLIESCHIKVLFASWQAAQHIEESIRRALPSKLYHLLKVEYVSKISDQDMAEYYKYISDIIRRDIYEYEKSCIDRWAGRLPKLLSCCADIIQDNASKIYPLSPDNLENIRDTYNSLFSDIMKKEYDRIIRLMGRGKYYANVVRYCNDVNDYEYAKELDEIGYRYTDIYGHKRVVSEKFETYVKDHYHDLRHLLKDTSIRLRDIVTKGIIEIMKNGNILGDNSDMIIHEILHQSKNQRDSKTVSFFNKRLTQIKHFEINQNTDRDTNNYTYYQPQGTEEKTWLPTDPEKKTYFTHIELMSYTRLFGFIVANKKAFYDLFINNNSSGYNIDKWISAFQIIKHTRNCYAHHHEDVIDNNSDLVSEVEEYLLKLQETLW